MVTRTRTTTAATATASRKRPAKEFNPTDNVSFDYNEKTGELVIKANLKAGFKLSDKGNKIFSRHGFSTPSPEGLEDFMFNVVVMERPVKPVAASKAPARKRATGDKAVIAKNTAKASGAGKAVIKTVGTKAGKAPVADAPVPRKCTGTAPRKCTGTAPRKKAA